MRAGLAAVAALVLAGCSPRRPPPVPTPHYVIGAPYEIGGTWYYPRESFRYEATGLAERVPDKSGLTADGEVFDMRAMAGAHQTLQLPAIALVTNLENGRQVRLRLNDRGPANPGRLIGLTAQAAELVGMGPGAVAQVRVEVESGPSQALRDRLQGGPQGITAAPVAAVVTESLPAPGGRSSALARVATPLTPDSVSPRPEIEVPDRLPATAAQGMAQPGQLWLRAGQFSQSTYANALKSKLSSLPVQIRSEAGRRMPTLVVMAGPFVSVAAADAALDQARAAGVTDAVIVVE